MIVIDTSALVAILKVESDAGELLRRLGESQTHRIATATVLEAQMVVICQLGDAGLAELELLLSRAQIQPVSFGTNHLHWALHGWRRFGRGRRKAALNLGDCFSCALTKALDEPLLFKGEDFHYTDRRVAD